MLSLDVGSYISNALVVSCHDRQLVSTLQGSTFGIPGVEQHACFLRDVRHAEAIRAQLIENIALAGVPGEIQVRSGVTSYQLNHCLLSNARGASQGLFFHYSAMHEQLCSTAKLQRFHVPLHCQHPVKTA